MRYVTLQQEAFCQDCGAILAPGERAREYVSRSGRVSYYCADGHQGQANGPTAQGRPRGNRGARKVHPQGQAQTQAQPKGNSLEYVTLLEVLQRIEDMLVYLVAVIEEQKKG